MCQASIEYLCVVLNITLVSQNRTFCCIFDRTSLTPLLKKTPANSLQPARKNISGSPPSGAPDRNTPLCVMWQDRRGAFGDGELKHCEGLFRPVTWGWCVGEGLRVARRGGGEGEGLTMPGKPHGTDAGRGGAVGEKKNPNAWV